MNAAGNVARWVPSRRALAMVAALAVVLPLLAPRAAEGEHFQNQVELEAAGNVAAAIAFSAEAFPDGAEQALLGRDDVFADSLSSGGAQPSRPLLLTASDALSPETSEELERLGVATVHILGGTSAVSEAVEQQLVEQGYEVQRHEGGSRVETAVAVAGALVPDATVAVIARAFGDEGDETRAFADSLSAGGWAAASSWPILLTASDELSAATAAYLEASAVAEVFVAGGTAAISDAVVAELEAQGLTVTRVSGPTRFHTAIAIAAERGFTKAGDAERIIVTDGQIADAWASGFAAAALSAIDDAPIVLSNQGELPEATTAFLGDSAGTGLVCSPTSTGAVCDAAAEALELEPSADGGEGGEDVALSSTSVARYDDLEGQLGAPDAVDTVRLSGCLYDNERAYVYDDGAFFVMVGAPVGPCTLTVTLDLFDGEDIVREFELNVGEAGTASSSTVHPELVNARLVLVDEEGVHVRFRFDEEIAPTIEDAKLFKLWTVEGVGFDNASSMVKDPRNPRAVMGVFPVTTVARTTTATVDFDAVRNVTNRSSLAGHDPVKDFVRSLAATPNRPDLTEVGEYDPATQSLLFRFTRAFVFPGNVQPPLGAAKLVMADGSLKSSDANGWAVAADGLSARVSFATDGLGPDVFPNVRRAYVEKDMLDDAVTNENNHLVALVVQERGRTDGPDFIGITDANPNQDRATFIFDGTLDSPTIKKEGFEAVLEDGRVFPGKSALRHESSFDRVVVTFDGDLTNENPVLYYTVLDGAVRFFADGAIARADTIPFGRSSTTLAGDTAGPDLHEFRTTTEGADFDAAGLYTQHERYNLIIDFNEQFDTWTGQATGKSIYLFKGSGSGVPLEGCKIVGAPSETVPDSGDLCVRFDLLDSNAPSQVPGVGKCGADPHNNVCYTVSTNRKQITLVLPRCQRIDPGENVANCPDTGSNSTSPARHAIHFFARAARYVMIEEGFVRVNATATTSARVNYGAGIVKSD